MSDKKQITVGFEITIQSLRSQLELANKSNSILLRKNAIIVEDNQKKDQFIQRWIVNKAKTEEERITIDLFFEKYKR